jgi:hypothetical protein
VNLVNAPVISEIAELPLKFREQFDVINEVSLCFFELLNDTLRIVMWFARFQDLIDTEMAVPNEFTILHVHHIGEAEYFFIIRISHSHYSFLIRLEILVEHNKCPLIVEMSLVDDLDREV